MDVRRYTVKAPWQASSVAWLLEQAGIYAEAPRFSSDDVIFVFVENGQEADADVVLNERGRTKLIATERLDPAGPTASAVRRRWNRDRQALGSSSLSLPDVPFTAEQTGVSVTLRDGSTVDMAQGRTFEVRPSGHLHVYRGERRVGVVRDGRWVHAIRTFGPPTTADGENGTAPDEGDSGKRAASEPRTP